MAANYLFIAKTKQGEMNALANARGRHKDLTLPLFDLSRMGQSLKRFKDARDVTQAYVNETAVEIAKVWKGRAALIDAMRWPVDSTLRSGEYVPTYFYRRLVALGVNVIPVLGYDRWESEPYREAINTMELPDDPQVCLRLDSDAMNDAAEPGLLREQVLKMLEDIAASPRSCRVLLDFEDATVVSVEQMIQRGYRVMNELADLGFKDFATAGSSIPPSIEIAVAEPDSTGRLIRREWTVWRTLRAAYPRYSWLFGDYGVRGPKSADDIISPHTNGKIRYTTSDSFFIARGHSMQLEGKGEQMYELAQTIMNSRHYMGSDFSWGDEEIVRCSRGEFKGTSTTWIAIDTSHHMAWVVQEVAEHVMRTDQAREIR